MEEKTIIVQQTVSGLKVITKEPETVINYDVLQAIIDTTIATPI